MPVRSFAAIALVAVGLAGCGSSSKSVSAPTAGVSPGSIQPSSLVASMKAVLVAKYKAPQPVAVHCQGGAARAGQVVECDVISSAGRGYRVQVKPPCWTATFNGKIIEGPGFAPPGQRPKTPVPTGPSNLPDTFSGCVK